jgi:hypothetical protein
LRRQAERQVNFAVAKVAYKNFMGSPLLPSMSGMNSLYCGEAASGNTPIETTAIRARFALLAYQEPGCHKFRKTMHSTARWPSVGKATSFFADLSSM